LSIRQEFAEFLIDLGSWYTVQDQPGANLLYTATVLNLRQLAPAQALEINDTISKMIDSLETGTARVNVTRDFSTEGLDPNNITLINDNNPPVKAKFNGAFQAYKFSGKYTQKGEVKVVNLSIAADVKSALDDLHQQGYTDAFITSAYRDYAGQKKLYDEYRTNKRATPAADPDKGNHRTGEAVDINLNWRNGQSEAANYVILKQTMAKYRLFNYVANDPIHFSRSGN
jgi:hypothetical protein